jgi:copper(I)-binding protein
MRLHRILVPLAVAGLIAGSALAHGFKAGSLEIEHPWARATAPSARTGAVYLTVNNTGAEADRFVSASTPVAEHTELHTTINDNGVMRMRAVDSLEVAPGSPATLAPGALHLMLMGLKEPLTKGKAFALTLTFEKAGPVTVQVAVQGAGDTAPEHHGMGM